MRVVCLALLLLAGCGDTHLYTPSSQVQFTHDYPIIQCINDEFCE